MENYMRKFLFLVTVLVVGSMSLMATEGALTGKFTINAQGDQVVFSQGNLQYQASTQTWRFAEHQYDFVGDSVEGNVYEGGVKCNNALISDDYSGWIDLFGWGTGNNPTLRTTNINDYSTFTEWGSNAISNGGNTENFWKTLTQDEWYYIFFERENASLRKGSGYIDGTPALIVLPDNWVQPEGISVYVSTYESFQHIVGDFKNTFTAAEWSVLEANGAICLPFAGNRDGDGSIHMTFINYNVYGWPEYRNGEYWTPIDLGASDESAYIICFRQVLNNLWVIDEKYKGLAVRLARVANNTSELAEVVEEANHLYNDILELAQLFDNDSILMSAAEWFLPLIQEADSIANDPGAPQEVVDSLTSKLTQLMDQVDLYYHAYEIYCNLMQEGVEEIAATYLAAILPVLDDLLNENLTKEEYDAIYATIISAYDAAMYAYEHLAIENTCDENDHNKKVLHNGILTIERNGRTFNALGTEIK
jgi:hypothetical protein